MMNEDTKKTFGEIVEILECDKKEIQKKFSSNLDRISEINVTLISLLDKETDEKKAKYIEEKKFLDEENKILYKKINKLNVILNKLNRFQSKDSIYKVVPRKNNNEYNSLVLLEKDRQRIAKDLHDTSLQNLAAITHKVELASMYIDQDPIRAKLELNAINNSIKETINEIRDTIFELRPMTFDDFGFKELLDAYIDKEIEKNGIKVVLDKYCLNVKEQSILLSTFRVLKECLGNSFKHSQCDEIHLKIDDSNNENLYIEISDNGIGFDIEEKKLEKSKHFGLIIIEERVKLMQGDIDITSNENGTKIKISVPIRNLQQ